ncbi:MAG: RES domain-containing protein [Chitinophagaceae bacterium]|jgi:RES domain-containing protein|nr:MAG: RES domain-containing protein [Chitinophagaceae bacterium]
MEVFRIAKSKFIDDLSGAGSRLHGGRWNKKGTAVVYTSCYRSLAALELIVHVPQKNLTNDYQLAIIDIPEGINMKIIYAESLPEHWRTVSINPHLQSIGDRWLAEGIYCILQVPSVVIPQEWNYVINPAHPEAKEIRIVKTEDLILDERFVTN